MYPLEIEDPGRIAGLKLLRRVWSSSESKTPAVARRMKADRVRAGEQALNNLAEIACVDTITLDRVALGIFRVPEREWLLADRRAAVEEHRNFPICLYPVMQASTGGLRYQCLHPSRFPIATLD